MASALATQKFCFENILQMWDHDPGATTALITTPDGGTTKRVVDMKDASRFVAAVMATVIAGGGTGLTKVEIIACDSSDGTGNVTVVKERDTIAGDAQGDWVVLECSAQELRDLSEAAGASLRYVAVRITCNNAGDEAAVVYLRQGLRHPALDSTAATTIA